MPLNKPENYPIPWRTLLCLWIAVVGVTLVITLAYWPMLARAIAFEDSPVAWLQTSLLVSIVILSIVLGHTQMRSPWFVMAACVFLMALDERFMGHERIKFWLLERVYHGDVNLMSWRGDAPLLIYPAGGLAILAALRGALTSFTKGFFAAAFGVGVIAIFLDLLNLRLSWQIVEELLELVAETLFTSALLIEVTYEIANLRHSRHVQELGL